MFWHVTCPDKRSEAILHISGLYKVPRDTAQNRQSKAVFSLVLCARRVLTVIRNETMKADQSPNRSGSFSNTVSLLQVATVSLSLVAVRLRFNPEGLLFAVGVAILGLTTSVLMFRETGITLTKLRTFLRSRKILT